jgi:hypothetical protein
MFVCVYFLFVLFCVLRLVVPHSRSPADYVWDKKLRKSGKGSNKNVSVRLSVTLNLRKLFTDCCAILTQRCV